MDTAAELDMQENILIRAFYLNEDEPTPEHANYLELCQIALTAAYTAHQEK